MDCLDRWRDRLMIENAWLDLGSTPSLHKGGIKFFKNGCNGGGGGAGDGKFFVEMGESQELGVGAWFYNRGIGNF